MSDTASGAAAARQFNPDTDTHHALSEDAELELRLLFGAIEAVGQVMDTWPGQEAPEIEPHHIAPLFYTFARHGQRILADATLVFPRRTERKAA